MSILRRFSIIASFCFAFGLAIASVPAFAGDAAPAPGTSVTPAQAAQMEDFLKLPAYDLERKATAPIRVGDAFELETSTIAQIRQAGSGTSLSLPPGVTALDDQGVAIEKVAVSEGKITATVAAIRSGDLTIPSLAIVAPAEKNAPPRAVARTNPFPVKIISAIPANDPKPQEAVPARPPMTIAFPTWILVIAGGLGILILGSIFYAIYRWSRSRPKYAEPTPVGPPLTEDEAALAALGAVERTDRGAANIKKYVFRVSDILKAYIGQRYGFDAPERTTSELIAHLEGLNFDAGQLSALKSLFAALDLVKFADHVPALDESAQFVIEARKFVLATRKRKVTA